MLYGKIIQHEEAITMDVNVHLADPREHVNEEPRDDLGDLMTGFFGMAGFMFLIFLVMVLVKFFAG